MNQEDKDKLIMDRIEGVQKELHEFIEQVNSTGSKASYQDSANIFFIYKISQLQQRVIDLEKENIFNQ